MYNHTVIGVFPTEDHPCTPFAYTVGLETELLMTGKLDIQVMGQLLNAVTELEDEVEAGMTLPGILGGGYLLHVLEVRDMREAEMFQSTGTRALQLVWPDSAGKFPWDEGYEYSADPEVQPLFGNVV